MNRLHTKKVLDVCLFAVLAIAAESLDSNSVLNQEGTHIVTTTRTLCLHSDGAEDIPAAVMPCMSRLLGVPLPGVERGEDGELYRTVKKSTVTLSAGRSVTAQELHLHPGQVLVEVDNDDGSSLRSQHLSGVLSSDTPLFTTQIQGPPQSSDSSLRGRRMGSDDAMSKYWRLVEEFLENGRSVSRYSLDAEEVIREQGDENIKQFTGYVNAGIIPNRYEFFEDAETGAPLRMEAINTQMQAAGSGPLEITTFDSVTSGALLGEAADSVDDALKFILHNDPPVSGSSSLPLRLMGTADHSDIPKVDAVAGPWAESLRAAAFYASDPHLDVPAAHSPYWDGLRSTLEAAKHNLASTLVSEYPPRCTDSSNPDNPLLRSPLCFSLRRERSGQVPGTDRPMDQMELYLRLVDQTNHANVDTLDSVFGVDDRGKLVYAKGEAQGCGTVAQLGFAGQGLTLTLCLGGQLSLGQTEHDNNLKVTLKTGLKVANVGIGMALSETLGLHVDADGSLVDLYSQTTIAASASIVNGAVSMSWIVGPSSPGYGLGTDWDAAAYFQALFGVDVWLYKNKWEGSWQIFHAGPLKI